MKLWPPISRISSTDRTVYFEDGSSPEHVDYIIFATGYTWSLPFLPDIPLRNNRIPDLYLHIFRRQDPSLVFIGATSAGFTFKVFEWQAVLAARASLPSLEEQEKWEADRIALRGDGKLFYNLFPGFGEYFGLVRKMAGEPSKGRPGRKLPEWDQRWYDEWFAGQLMRIEFWKRSNEAARKKFLAEGYASESAKL